MNGILLVARSITHAQQMQKAMNLVGIWSRIIRGPREIIGSGCGYTVQIGERDLNPALNELERRGIWPSRVYLYRREGYEEVLL